ncbi:J domain-containing protein [Rhodanobacter sp. DHG33]|uniref:J domain-containing protein n=1 Tax=Rhodanobacter sp. DHG33 TaxID=2775921 RepID=UPI00177B1F35|nr:J domain-containing protein [Rhodanobacter sp. DHG33]MBD8899144.1 J domain-containing protein [Rhodanobacter sp. DHG33]
MSGRDPLGYYEVLGIHPSATAAEIKAAFRRKAMEYHPDRCTLPNATALFQKINTAFSVLGNPESRAEYDTEPVKAGPAQGAKQGSARRPPHDPVRCSVCDKVSAQPIYVIFYRVTSLVLATRRDGVQGIYCKKCAEKACFKATAHTWLLGWWGFPWGPIYTLSALFTNLVGGKRPATVNARVLAHQAQYFADIREFDLARAIANEALKLALKLPPNKDNEAAELRAFLDAFIAALPSTRTLLLPSRWDQIKRMTLAQLGAMVLLFGGLAYSINWNAQQEHEEAVASYNPTPAPDPQPVASEQNNSPQTAQNPPPSSTTCDLPAGAPPPPSGYVVDCPNNTRPSLSYERPAQAPNGNPWPAVAGYVSGYPKKYTNGYSTISIDNGQNGSDVFVKIVAEPAQGKAFPIRQLFIPAHGSFVAKNVRAGTYDVRYENLDTGDKEGTPSFTLTETPVSDGVEYSRYELTLYTVPDGNMQMHPLSDDEF